jgi:P-type Cu2+ transporter
LKDSAEGHAGEAHKRHENGHIENAKKMHRGRHEGHVTEDFKKRFIISLIVTIPILALAPLIQNLFRFKLAFHGSIFVLFLFSSFVYFMADIPS